MRRANTKPLRFTVPIPVWDSFVPIYVGTKLEEARKGYCKKIADVDFGKQTPGSQASLLFSEQSGACLIWFKDTCPGAPTVAHEALHAAMHILESKGLPITKENQEAIAYLQDYIIGKIGKKIW